MMFSDKQSREKKDVDLSTLPPCQSVLKLHAMRANAVAHLWKKTLTPNFSTSLTDYCGWDTNGDIVWI